MAKMYFNEYEPELCYPMDHHIDYMKMQDLQKITLTEAKMDKGSGHFYCKEHNFVGDRSEGTCGKICPQYAPRNGKNGRCKFSYACYTPTDKKSTILNPKYNN